MTNDKITIICTVAADFTNGEGGLFKIGPKDLGVITEAPAWIKTTLLFKWLLNDGSISFVDKTNKVQAENEPMKDIGADGKKAEPVEVEAVVEEAPKKRARKKVDAE